MVHKAILTRKTQVLAFRHGAHRAEVYRTELPDPTARTLIEAMNPQTSMCVPLIARNVVVGVMSFLSSIPGRRYGPADVQLADEIARRAALALENSRLYRLAQEALAARDEVLGIVTHDLRNPLNAISLQASLLRGRWSDPERRYLKPLDVIERWRSIA